MRILLCSLVLVTLTVAVAAVPLVPGDLHQPYRRADNSSTEPIEPFSLPESDNAPAARAQAIEIKRQNFLYGPPLVGGAPFFPAGSLGNATAFEELAEEYDLILAAEQAAAIDEANAFAAIIEVGGIQSLSDYAVLYKGQWTQSAPEGVDPGMLSNYTQDLLFSMERLSLNPYSIKRLRPTEDSLPFHVDNAIVKNLTGGTLQSLHTSGRLFYADHRAQANLSRTARYAAACDAYFYIHPESGDFMPLAIRPNAGSNLTYTPLDQANDWLLAKIMFNTNDFWYTNWYHFAATHGVIEIVYEAAIRTLSDDHPILAILDRICFKAFAFPIEAATKLVNPGGAIDQVFPFTGTAAGQFTTELYGTGGAGAFQANYFYTNLANRGLYNCDFGPELKVFPFFEDASVIQARLSDFMTSFVKSYYQGGDELAQDNELQAWIAEAIPAQIIDFPTAPLTQCSTLIDILTHLAFLASVVHHTLNTNDLFESMATLPFHPASLFAPIPTAKGVEDILPFLPPAEASIGQIGLVAFFARRTFVHTNLTLSSLFNNTDLLSRMNSATVSAAEHFYDAMGEISQKVSGRKFDEDGLSQGMPFVWKALDPEVIPFYLAA